MGMPPEDVDATEQHNIAKDHPDVVKRLTELHQAWAKEIGGR